MAHRPPIDWRSQKAKGTGNFISWLSGQTLLQGAAWGWEPVGKATCSVPRTIKLSKVAGVKKRLPESFSNAQERPWAWCFSAGQGYLPFLRLGPFPFLL